MLSVHVLSRLGRHQHITEYTPLVNLRHNCWSLLFCKTTNRRGDKLSSLQEGDAAELACRLMLMFHGYLCTLLRAIWMKKQNANCHGNTRVVRARGVTLFSVFTVLQNTFKRRWSVLARGGGVLQPHVLSESKKREGNEF